MKRLSFVWLVAGMSVFAGSGALADAIDGNWCHDDGRRMSIKGPEITTPGGTRMRGEYDRHAFAYVVPKGEDGAGGQVLMALIDDETLHVQARDTDQVVAPLQVWRRCSLQVSENHRHRFEGFGHHQVTQRATGG